MNTPGTWYAANTERAKAAGKVWYAANKGRKQATARARYAKNREHILAVCKAYYKTNRTKKLVYDKEYHKKYPGKKRAQWLQGQYKISPESFDVLLSKQSGVCAVCELTAWGNKGPVVDHNHITGEVRGILCNRCNLGIGHFRDDPKLLAKAIGYLQ